MELKPENLSGIEGGDNKMKQKPDNPVCVLKTNRKAAVLAPSSLACLSKIPTINLTAGCAHGCIYCYARGYSQYPGEACVTLYANTLDKLKAELRRKRKRPLAVYFSPSSDLFQPVPEVLELTFKILDFLFHEKIGVAFLTKGAIPNAHMELIRANASLVQAQIGLITLDENLARILEPRAAVPEQRLQQARMLVDCGIPAHVRLDPILPGITDDEQSLTDLVQALAGAGVKTIAAGVLFLRPAIVESFKRHLPDRQMMRDLLQRYRAAQAMKMAGDDFFISALPLPDRSRIFSRLETLARPLGITTKICACKNPELASASCSIAGEWNRAMEAPAQPNLF